MVTLLLAVSLFDPNRESQREWVIGTPPSNDGAGFSSAAVHFPAVQRRESVPPELNSGDDPLPAMTAFRGQYQLN